MAAGGVVLLAAAAFGEGNAVTLGSLLCELRDPERLTRLSSPAYRLLQATSTDLRSRQPHTPDWFANWDNANFVRTETVGSRTEFVLLDAAGPGAVVRIWSTQSLSQPYVLRVYLDGASVPAIAGDVAQVVGRGALVAAPLSFVTPQLATADCGQNLYLPIPFAGRCKVTVSTPDNSIAWPDFFFYSVAYRVYEPGTAVETYSAAVQARDAAEVEATRSALLAGAPPLPGGAVTNRLGGTLGWGGGSCSLTLPGPAAIRLLRFRLRAPDLRQALRSTLFEIDADDEGRAVRAPVGDFFGTGHHVTTGGTWFVRSHADGLLTAHWVQPFQRRGVVRLVNVGLQDVAIDTGDIVTTPYAWREDSLHFHAAWREHLFEDSVAQRGKDLNFVTLTGRGRYVGDSLCLFNGAGAVTPSPDANWWGEGDEKITVDNEPFPSHFGTGSEDYYGYAWCRPLLFATPFNAQLLGDGNARRGPTLNSRVRLLDDIPFAKALRFDMELWSWRTGRYRYAPTVYWYAQPGGACEHPDPRPAAAFPVADTAIGLDRAARVCPLGVRVEAEALPVLACSGGSIASIATNGLGLGADRCLAWQGGAVGSRLSLAVGGSFTGRCELVARAVAGPAAGVWRVSLNGEVLAAALDLRAPGVEPRLCPLGTVRLHAGVNAMEWESTPVAGGPAAPELLLDWLANAGPFHLLRDGTVVRGRLEGEGQPAEADGGLVGAGALPCPLSGGACLRWSRPAFGNTCRIGFTNAGPRQVALHVLLVGGTNGPQCEVALNGAVVAAADLRLPACAVTNLFLGEHALGAGRQELALRVTGCAPGVNPDALGLGVDALDFGSIYARRVAARPAPRLGPAEDADADGLSNLGEYAFGGDLMAADGATPLPRPRLWREGEAIHPAVVFRRRSPAGDLPVLGEEGVDLQVDGVQYRVQVADALGAPTDWLATNAAGPRLAACGTAAVTGGVEVCVHDMVPLAPPDARARFLRVVVQEP